MAFNAPCTRERSASSNTMTLFTESELYNGAHPSDRASIALFEKIFHPVRPSRNFANSKQLGWERFIYFFFFKRDSGFISVSAKESLRIAAGGFETFFFSLLEIPATPDRVFTVISVPKVDCALRLARSIYVVPSPLLPLLLSRHTELVDRPASSAGIKSRAVIMNDSRGEREDIIVIDGREGRGRG